MLIYTITGDNIAIGDQVRAYIEKRFSGFSRFVNPDISHEVFVTVSKTTAHHRDDSICVEVKLQVNAKDFFAAGAAADIMAAVDQAKEELMREVTHSKGKKLTLFHRGARKIKGMMKVGFGKRNKS